ncbi:MAG: dihydropteroate synthase [Planctomycetota bacterium]
MDARNGMVVMGVLNVTPDSFSDGGLYGEGEAGVESAVGAGVAMAEAGAGVIDVGGESTRPGAGRVGVEEQVRRVVPVVAGLRERLDGVGLGGVLISVDTTRWAVAEAALGAGAGMVNDVSAGEDDGAMLAGVARAGVGLALMHKKGEPATMQDRPRYRDVVEEVRGYLGERVGAAVEAGVQRGLVWVDPGIGFGKTLEHNLALLGALEGLVEWAAGEGLAGVLVGASRKRMIGELNPRGGQRPGDRLGGTVAITALSAWAGVGMVRVHDVAENVQAVRMVEAVKAVKAAQEERGR